jgi:hypothetical protein
MIDDCMNRTKVKRGSALPQSKLTEGDVRNILALVEHRDSLKKQASELTNASIAEKYGVHIRTVDRITSGESWGHIG